MADAIDANEFASVVDFIKDAMLADANPPVVNSAANFRQPRGLGFAPEIAGQITDNVSFQPADLCDESKAHLLAITPEKKKQLWGRLKSP
jgi:hypothetical protein